MLFRSVVSIFICNHSPLKLGQVIAVRHFYALEEATRLYQIGHELKFQQGLKVIMTFRKHSPAETFHVFEDTLGQVIWVKRLHVPAT